MIRFIKSVINAINVVGTTDLFHCGPVHPVVFHIAQ